jgi:hypothetical protein
MTRRSNDGSMSGGWRITAHNRLARPERRARYAHRTRTLEGRRRCDLGRDQAYFFDLPTLTLTVSTTVVLGCSSAKSAVTNNPDFALLGTFRTISCEIVLFEGVTFLLAVFFAMATHSKSVPSSLRPPHRRVEPHSIHPSLSATGVPRKATTPRNVKNGRPYRRRSEWWDRCQVAQRSSR